MKKLIKIWFADFWPNFELDNNYFLKLISKKYDPILDDINPDFVFYSIFGQKFRSFNSTRIFFTGENYRPNFNEADWAFSFDFNNHPRHYRLPLYPFFGDPKELVQSDKIDYRSILKQKDIFCNFIYSNAGPKERKDFFYKLSEYKKVHSGGRLFNNIGGRVKDKVDFLRRSKFTIAFENEAYQGYTTEKIFEPMLAMSIPIYWGNPNIDIDFNPESFINVSTFDSYDEAINKIIELDQDDDKYLSMLSKPWYHNNEISKYVKEENLLNQLEKIFSTEITPIANQTFAASSNQLAKSLNQKYYDTQYKLNLYKKKVRNFNLTKLKIKIQKAKEKRLK